MPTARSNDRRSTPPNRMPTLGALRMFEAAARHRSFKDAAAELGVTPAAVSFQVRQLEKDLGHRLFERGANAVALTDAAQAFFPKLTTGLQIVREAFEDYRAEVTTRPVRITSGPAVMAKWLVPRMVTLREMDPTIDVEFAASLNVLDLVRDRIDFAVRFGHAPSCMVGEGVSAGERGDPAGKEARHRTVRIVEEHVVPVAAPGVAEQLVSPDDLSGVQLIHDESLRLIDDATPAWRQWLAEAGANPSIERKGLAFSQSDHAVQAALDGAGVALARVVLAGPDIRAGRLRVPFGPSLPTGLYYYLIEPTEPDDPAIATVREWLEREVVTAFRELIVTFGS